MPSMVNTGLDLVGGADIINYLQFSAKISDNVTITLPQGRVVHVNSEQEFETGATGHQMPLYLWRASNSLDVTNPGLNDDGDIDYQAGFPKGITSAFPAICGMEVASAEYDDAETYAPNDLLRGITANSTAATGGLITKNSVTLYTDCVCGVVSRGVINNPVTRKDLLYFWAVYLPGSGA